MPGEFSPQTQCDELPQPESEDDVEDILYSLAREGGVKLVNHLLAQAVPMDDDSSPLDISKIWEWSFKDIMHMPDVQRKQWLDKCHEELDDLHRRKVYDLVDPPPGRKIIKNRWVFDIKSDGCK
jgi:hypothetical protein